MINSLQIKSFVILIYLMVLIIGVNAQSKRKANRILKKINSIEQIQILKNKFPKWIILEDKTYLRDSLKYPNVFSANVGDIILKQARGQKESYMLKILNFDQEVSFRVKYIFLDANLLSKSKSEST